MNGNNNHSTNSDAFPEARASFTVKFVDANGFESMLTLRGDNGLELLEKSSVAISYMVEHGATPLVGYRNGSRPIDNKTAENTTEEDKNSDKDNPGWCPIHLCEMRRWEKNGRVWYSHKVDGKWCAGK
jgi:hypothetical protein